MILLIIYGTSKPLPTVKNERALNRLINGETQSGRDNQFRLGETFQDFNIVVKKLIPAGQGYVDLKSNYGGKLWSPKTHQTCLIDVLKHGLKKLNIPATFPHYSTIYKIIQQSSSKHKNIKKDLTTFVGKPLEPKEIKYIFKAIGMEKENFPQVWVYAFGEDGLEKKYRLLYGEVAETTPTIYIIYEAGHYVWWSGPHQHKGYKKTITSDNFIYHEEEPPQNPDALPLKQEEPDYTELSIHLPKETYFFDFETCQSFEEHKHLVYWAGWTQLSKHFLFTSFEEGMKITIPRNEKGLFDPTAVRGEDSIVDYYGLDAMSYFINDLKRIALKQRNDFLREVAFKYQEKTGKALRPEMVVCDENNNIYPTFTDSRATAIADRCVRSHCATFFGYNNARFDNYLIIGQGGAGFCDKKMIDAHGILEYQMFGGLIIFRDLYRHLAPASLANACKDFGIPPHLSKGDAPHKFMREDTIYHKGAVPDHEYWKSKRIPKDLEDCDYWDAEQHIRTYAKRDVYATMLVAIAYYDAMNILTGGNALSKLTIPSVAWAVMSKHLQKVMNQDGEEQQVFVIKSVEVDKFIRKAIVGGRSVVSKSHYQTKAKDILEEIERTFTPLPEWEEQMRDIKDALEGHPAKVVDTAIKKGFNTFLKEHPELNENIGKRVSLLHKLKASKQYLVDQDANSLYPTAMAKFEYGVDEAEWVSPEEFPRIIDAIHTDTFHNEAIIECDITYPDKTCGVYFPVMATRPDKEGVNRYTYEDQHVWKHPIDLAEASKHNGMRITSITRVLIWRKKFPIFKEFVEKLYAERNRYKKEGKDALQQVIKLILNSAYGKLIQRIIQTETEFYNEDQLTKLDTVFRQGNYISHTDFGSRLLVQQIKKPTDDDIGMPSHLGVSVLAKSRKVMNDAIASIDGFNSLEQTCYYMDTDSMFITAEAEECMKQAGLLGNDLGQFKSDLKGVDDGMIVEGIFVAPKLYYLRFVGITSYGLPIIATTKKSKGTTTEGISRDDYLTMLNGEMIEVQDQHQMKRRIDGEEGTGIYSKTLSKKLNERQWGGKECHPHPDYHNLWLPHAQGVAI